MADRPTAQSSGSTGAFSNLFAIPSYADPATGRLADEMSQRLARGASAEGTQQADPINLPEMFRIDFSNGFRQFILGDEVFRVDATNLAGSWNFQNPAPRNMNPSLLWESLHDELRARVLARIPPWQYGVAGFVCTDWRAAMQSSWLRKLRRLWGHKDRFLLVTGGMDAQPLDCCQVLGPSLEGNEIVSWPGLGQARRGHTCDFMGDTIYVVGGWIRNDMLTSSVQCFSYDSNCWAAGAPLLQPRGAHANSVVNNKIVVMGGQRRQHAASGWTEDITVVTSTVEFLALLDPIHSNPDENAIWVEAPAMMQPRSGASSAVLKGQLYIAGGFQNDVSGDHGMRSVEVWDVDPLSEWQEVSPMRQGRGDFELCVIKDTRLLAVGGRSEIGSAGLSSVEEYLPQSDTWVEIHSLNVPRMAFGSVCLDDHLLLVGGLPYSGEQRPLANERFSKDSEGNDQWVIEWSTGRCRSQGAHAITMIDM